MSSSPKAFVWYELMTGDVDAAETFYAAVVGWQAQPYAPSPMRYTVMNADGRGVAGIMAMPVEYKESGGRPAWTGYIYSDDVDATAESVKKAGGAVHRPPADIPGIGRFAVVADPQGAMFMLIKPIGPDQPPVPVGTIGHVAWHELYASDSAKAFAFYADQFGWTKGDPFDMGPMGTYQLFAAGGAPIGGMMNKPEGISSPVWNFYFNVAAIDAASSRVTDNGGRILNGPHQVPGGSWMVQCMDPQGATFALLAPGR